MPGGTAATQRIDANPNNAEDYERIRGEIMPDIIRLSQRLEEILRPQRRLSERGGYPHGSRIDLGKLMQFSADPRQHDRLWKRKTLPERRNMAFSLLVDMSGSMRHGKAQAATKGIILMAEALQRLAIPFAINGMNDELLPIKTFNQPLVCDVRRRIAAIPRQSTSKWNDDGPCLEKARAQLVAFPASWHFLVVVSDGLPEGSRSGERELKAAIQACHETPGLRLIGLGIGSGTEHVSRFYPSSIVNIDIGTFPDTLAELVHELIAHDTKRMQT